MSNNGPFGFDPDDFDRMVREAGDSLRDALGNVFQQSGQRPGWSTLFDQAGRRARPEPETTGEIGEGSGRSSSSATRASRPSNRCTRPNSTRCAPTSTTPTPSGRSGSSRTASPSPHSTNRTTNRSTKRSDRVAGLDLHAAGRRGRAWRRTGRLRQVRAVRPDTDTGAAVGNQDHVFDALAFARRRGGFELCPQQDLA